MERIDDIIERLTEPDAVANFRERLRSNRVAWRIRNRAYVLGHGKRQGTRPRWPLLKLRRHFLKLGVPCQRCSSWSQLEVSHKLAVNDGGSDSLDNIEWLCHSCHVAYANPAFATP